jgi:hypothetical protein
VDRRTWSFASGAGARVAKHGWTSGADGPLQTELAHPIPFFPSPLWRDSAVTPVHLMSLPPVQRVRAHRTLRRLHTPTLLEFSGWTCKAASPASEAAPNSSSITPTPVSAPERTPHRWPPTPRTVGQEAPSGVRTALPLSHVSPAEGRLALSAGCGRHERVLVLGDGE